MQCFQGAWTVSQRHSPLLSRKDLDSEDNLSDSSEDLTITMSIASRDRTIEFQSVFKSLKSRQVSL